MLDKNANRKLKKTRKLAKQAHFEVIQKIKYHALCSLG